MITERKRNSKNHVSNFGEGIFYLSNVLISLTTVFAGSSPNFNAVCKAGTVHHSSLMDIVSKEEMRVKKQLL